MDPKEHYRISQVQADKEVTRAAQIAADKARALEMLMNIIANTSGVISSSNIAVNKK